MKLDQSLVCNILTFGISVPRILYFANRLSDRLLVEVSIMIFLHGYLIIEIVAHITYMSGMLLSNPFVGNYVKRNLSGANMMVYLLHAL